jgi:hypothetical protein
MRILTAVSGAQRSGVAHKKRKPFFEEWFHKRLLDVMIVIIADFRRVFPANIEESIMQECLKSGLAYSLQGRLEL